MAITYKDSGVDVDAGGSFVKKISPIVKSTFSERVLTGIGGFGALFSGSFPEMKDPVLVSGTDGVGTKLKIAQMMNIHHTIGIDAVAMCVNDIVVSGAKPLFFLDYIACGRLKEDVLVDVVRGIAEGCIQSDCSLVGGETAEHPNVMPDNDYDIAGFSVGVVDREKIINGSKIKENGVVIGLPSTGIHSNGYSLVRKIFLDVKKYDLNKKYNDFENSLGEILLEPTKIYTKAVMAALAEGCAINGLVHITGGGFYENIPRILPQDIGVKIDKKTFNVLPIFRMLQKDGDVAEREMFSTFNMGIGMMIFAEKSEADKIIESFKKSGLNPAVIGETVKNGAERVVLI